MENPRHDDFEPRTVQAHRFELIDRRGRIRAVLGDLGGPDDGFEPGLELVDRMGGRRASFCLRRSGPALVLIVDGTEVLGIGVKDDTELTDEEPSYDPFAYLWLADGRGEPAMALRVHHDRDVHWETIIGPETRSEAEDHPVAHPVDNRTHGSTPSGATDEGLESQ